MTASVFISYSSKDREVAGSVCDALERRGFKCWISSRDIRPGENFQQAIVKAIRSARVMVLVFTTNANSSNEIMKEVALAGQNQLVVIPVRVEDVLPNDAFAYEFATRQWVDLFDDWEKSLASLAAQLTATIHEPGTPPPVPSAPVPSPPPAPVPPAAVAAPAPRSRLAIYLGGAVALLAVGAAAAVFLSPKPRMTVAPTGPAPVAAAPAAVPQEPPVPQIAAAPVAPVASPPPKPMPVPAPSPPPPSHPPPQAQPSPASAPAASPPPPRPAVAPITGAAAIRQASWRLGETLSRAVLLFGSGASQYQVDQALSQARTLADGLGVSFRALPDRTAAGGDTHGEAMRYLAASGALAGELADTHSHDDKTLFELAMRTNVVAETYEPGKDLLAAHFIRTHAEDLGLPTQIWMPVVRSIDGKKPPDEVKSAIVRMHQEVAAYLSNQR
jgi:outer membrane biosynthesis protein TonB